MIEARRRGRPLKDGPRLEPVATNVDPVVYEAIKATAKRRGVPIAEVLRSILNTAFSYRKIDSASHTSS